MLARFVRVGCLEVTFPDGTMRRYGRDASDPLCLHLRDTALLRALVRDPEMALGEGYMDGRLTIGGDRLHDFLTLVLRNRQAGGLPAWARGADVIRFALRDWVQRNTPGKARMNVAHHYDLSNDLYRRFLDTDMQYSCAYFARPDMTLEQAQAAKKAHIAAKLLLQPDMHVLDIGCGWGGMAITLARDYGVRVTAVTLSANQLELGRARVAQAGLSDRVDLRLMDYRKLTGPYDRIVSIGMFEHVGLPQYQTYFGKLRDLLTPDGVALIHTIGRVDRPHRPSGWLTRYIFPGGYVPSLAEVAGPVERSGLWLTDLEVWRLHYARTLAEWLKRFEAELDAVRATHDERFIRMWRYYLTACQATFEVDRQGVFQVQLARRADAVPLTRDYIARLSATGPVAAQ
ncbi:cyclopropane-fatty-acyl-phospholipid synthase [Rhodovulum adriaticum]|uniref:Cyclopropane-fatty-acyl-phospholipid synthase n=2 Tax=Rhodovulum adriaticum TaxID=35804 RepID=A0A4R2NMI2_RHOAD|nr:cyclopropane-fatty-acyl-phospholipid synthase [Rhodovulum adriaticum]